MTATRRILRDTMAWAALIALATAVVAGPGLGLQVAIAGAATVGNVLVFAFASERYVTSVAAGEGGGVWGAFLSSKIVLTASLVVLAMFVLSPLAVAIGLSALFFGVATTGITLASRPTPWAVESR